MASNDIRYYMEFNEGVWKAARGAVMADELSIRPRGAEDAMEFYSLPNEPGRMYNLGPALEERGWRLVSDVEYLGGRRVWALVERVEGGQPTAPAIEEAPAIKETDTVAETAPRFVVNQLGNGYFAVRDTVTDLDVATTTSRYAANDIAERREAEAAGSSPEKPKVVETGGCPAHGVADKRGLHAASLDVTCCADATSYGVWDSNAGGFVHIVDCAMDAANWAAEQFDEDPDGEMSIKAVCPEHEEQPADSCEDCNAEADDEDEYEPEDTDEALRKSFREVSRPSVSGRPAYERFA